MPRFFISEENVQNDVINITGDDVNHIKNVLRLKIGEIIILNSGKGTDYQVRIEKYEPGFVRTAILSAEENKTEPPINITLYQGIPKSDKMDFIIQKSVELGIKRIVPVITERTIVKFGNNKDIESKTSRWQKISFEAAKQCNRGGIPKVELPVNFDKALELIGMEDLGLIPYEKESVNNLKDHLKNDLSAKNIAVFIGPEGGFSEKEVDKAVKSGIKPVTLGPRILRTETAGIAVLAIIMYELGDVGR